eukprot:746752-Hanusia_phi.AAC.1
MVQEHAAVFDDALNEIEHAEAETSRELVSEQTKEGGHDEERKGKSTSQAGMWQAGDDAEFASSPDDLNKRRRTRIRYRFSSLIFVLLSLLVLILFLTLGFWRGWDNWIQLNAITSWSDLARADLWERNSAPSFLVLLFVILVSLAVCMRPPRDAELKTTSPFDHASSTSIATFWWVFPTLMMARRKQGLVAGDLPPLSLHDLPCNLRRSFCDLCDRNPNLLSSPWRLWWSVTFSAQKSVFFHSFFSGWAFLAAMFIDPILLKLLLSSASHQGQEGQDGAKNLQFRLLLIALLFISMLVRVTCMEQCYFNSLRVANNARSILVMAVFRAALRGHRTTAEAGRLTNLLATVCPAHTASPSH